KNVTVSNCILNSACHPMRVGGENVVISDILVYGPGLYPHPPSDKYNTMSAIVHIGVRPLAPGAPVDELFRPLASDNLVFSNITMTDVRSPVYMAPGACCRWPEGNPGAGLKKIFINNMTVVGAGKLPIAVVGVPKENRIESVVLNNVRLTFDGGIQQANGY